MLGFQEKQPADVDSYAIDFSRWLPDGDTVTTCIAAVSPAYDPVTNPNGLQVTSTSIGPDGMQTQVWCAGGVDGKTYKVTVTAATSGGRVKEVDFQMRVKDC